MSTFVYGGEDYPFTGTREHLVITANARVASGQYSPTQSTWNFYNNQGGFIGSDPSPGGGGGGLASEFPTVLP